MDALSANDVERTQPIDSIEIYAFGKIRNSVSEKEEIKSSYVIKQYRKWLTFWKEKIKEHVNWQQSPDHAYIMVIIGGSWSGKTNALFNW